MVWHHCFFFSLSQSKDTVNINVFVFATRSVSNLRQRWADARRHVSANHKQTQWKTQTEEPKHSFHIQLVKSASVCVSPSLSVSLFLSSYIGQQLSHSLVWIIKDTVCTELSTAQEEREREIKNHKYDFTYCSSSCEAPTWFMGKQDVGLFKNKHRDRSHSLTCHWCCTFTFIT